jgi:L-amino acid N-acyltransferase YncA
MPIAIRPATEHDLPAIVHIYNEAVAKKGLTADLELVTVEQRRDWFAEHTERYPILVATSNSMVVGWISLSPYRKGRKALDATAEVSLYITNGLIGKGVGSDMMQSIIALAGVLGYHNMIAILIGTNERSIGLFRKYGFELWGTMPGIIEIDGKRYNHCFYGKQLLQG